MKKLTPAQKETWKPAHLPRHYYPGYVFIPKNGYFQARKIGLTAERVHRDPRFHKTRLLAKEFAQLAVYAKLIRAACCTGTTIKCNAYRLQGLLNRILQQDEAHICGSRKLLNGDLSLLEGFNFNQQALMEETCKIDWEFSEGPEANQVVVQLPSFVPEYFILPPAGIQYCRIYLISAILNLDQTTYTTIMDRTSLIPLKRMHVATTELTVQNTAAAGLLTITALGITWYEHQNGYAKLMPSSTPGPLTIISAY